MIPRLPLTALAVLSLVMPARAEEGPAGADAEARNVGVARAALSVPEIIEQYDRDLIRDLAEHIRLQPQADDLEQAYMVVFNKAIDHDWFAENEALAARYLAEQPEGAVRPLAQIVATMARAQAGKFDEALPKFRELMRGLGGPEQEEFASNFADALATSASAAGAYDAARQVYEGLLDRFGESPTLRQKVRDDLARLDRVGKPAPSVTVRDLAGQELRLEDLRGKYVLVDFWATWCAPCVAELPRLRKAYEAYHDRGLEVVAVSLDETPGPVADFVKARTIPWRQVHNATAGGDLVAAFGINSIPATFLIDPEGVIRRLELRGPALDKALGELLGEEPAE